MPSGLLDGIRVIDFTQALSGPTLTRYLAELGADVVKVEVPPTGDITRLSQTVRDGRSGYYLSVNRAKRSLCVDIKDPRGRDVVLDLLDGADVLAENFRPGTVERLGFGWDVVHARNPRLVMCSISAFGQEGSLAQHGGYDGVAQAYAGITSMNGEAGGAPIVAGAAMGDVLTGVNAVAAVLGALYQRERTGRGQWVSVSLLEAYMQAHDSSIQSFSLTDGQVVQTRSGRFHPMACPYGIFTARDGYLFICAAADRHWRDLCAAMARPDLATGHPWSVRASREAEKAAVNAFLDGWLSSLPSRDEALALLQRHGVPVGPVHSIDEVVRHPDLRAIGAVRTASDPVVGRLDVPGFPLRFSDPEALPVHGPDGEPEAAFLGEHNREIAVDRAGLHPDRYAELVADGVLVAEPVTPRPSRQR
jgi:crotonobetainyl-CoA:carnitine CoA-transferase CaiB-like acyl-CoA transferase